MKKLKILDKLSFVLIGGGAIISTPFIITSCHKFDPNKPMFNYEIIPNKEHDGLTGKQGIALDDKYYYVDNNNRLTKYDKNWNVIKDITDVNTHFPGSNDYFHIGDIEVFNDTIYTVGENFEDNIGTSIAVGLFNTNLDWTRTINIFPEVWGINEVSGITIDGASKTIYISSWCNGDSGQYIYAFKYPNFEFITKIKTNPWVQKIQGIKYYDNYLFATADDDWPWSGQSQGMRDHVYRIDPKTGDAVLEHTFTESQFPDQKETEGITIDKKTGEFIIMQDQGNDTQGNHIYVVNFFKTTKAQ